MKKIFSGAVKAFLKRWQEYIPAIVALLVWMIAGPVVRLFSPTAGTDDAGLVQALIFGLVLYFAACAFSWFALRTVFPGIGKFVDNQMSDEIQMCSDQKTRLWIPIALFAIYFFGAIIILASTI